MSAVTGLDLLSVRAGIPLVARVHVREIPPLPLSTNIVTITYRVDVEPGRVVNTVVGRTS